MDIKTEDLKQFVRQHSQIYIGLTGCIREFDEIASEFVNNYSPKAYDIAVAKANQLIDGYDSEKVDLFMKVTHDNVNFHLLIYFS